MKHSLVIHRWEFLGIEFKGMEESELYTALIPIYVPHLYLKCVNETFIIGIH
jgi:hypothetical protein